MMTEPRCIAQLLRNESPVSINFTITHGRGRQGVVIRTRKLGIFATAKLIFKSRGLSLCRL